MTGRGTRGAGRGLRGLRGGVLFVGVLASLVPRLAPRAQVPPNATWRTLRTAHFSIHFTLELEEIARRTAANAERAYAQLAAELTPPRGRIDLVVSDNVDYSNGTATPFPSNRIVIYANPPVESSALRFNDDWNTLVVTHELTHVFHLDRVRGIWRLAQRVFGRAPPLFPNGYAPSWLTEGLAVYFESRLTGSGRLVGSEHRMIARSTALEHRFPRLDELSVATPRFPGGQAAYAYGSLIVDHLARTRGPGRVRDLVERTSGQLIPFLLNRPASRAFGATFQQAWAELRDSLVRQAGSPRPPLSGWIDLTPGAYLAALPRWLNDTAVVYTGATTRDVHGAYRVDVRGGGARSRWLGRRNNSTANVPLRGGGLLYSQLDFTDAYHIRSDLYVDRNDRTVRLTRGARLSSADARADGAIVAAQAVPGGSRLVRVSADGSAIVPLIPGGPDAQWMEPRWSPNGRLIAAAAWRRGGITSIVILDTLGNPLQEISPARAVQGAPSWSPDGDWVLFSSDRSGTPDVYAARVSSNSDQATAARAQSLGVLRVGNAPTGLFEPQLSPDGRTLGAILFRADGYHVGVAPFEAAVAAARARSADTGTRSPPIELGAPARDTGRVRSYSPWSSLRPRYWLPLFEAGLGNGYRLGGMTSGQDLVGRHAYGAQLLVPTDGSGLVGAVDYRYARLGQPVLGATFFQDWELRARLVGGDVRRRTQSTVVSATFSRPRYRSFAALTVGGGVQARHFAVAPPELRASLPPAAQRALADSTYPRAFVSGTWGNTYRSAYAISPEGGVTLTGSVDQRWGRGSSAASTRTYIGAATGYKSLDLPGFARHVVALRVAGGIADREATTALEVGGTSGGTLSILPGYTVGTGRYPFPVRGFSAASLEGSRATAASVEYRAPLFIPARGVGLLPLFVDRTSVSFFYDTGAAWCPTSLASLCFPAGNDHRWIASVGGEVNVSAAVLSWDAPYRFRLGLAHPVTRPVGAPSLSLYFAIGLAF